LIALREELAQAISHVNGSLYGEMVNVVKEEMKEKMAIGTENMENIKAGNIMVDGVKRKLDGLTKAKMKSQSHWIVIKKWIGKEEDQDISQEALKPLIR